MIKLNNSIVICFITGVRQFVLFGLRISGKWPVEICLFGNSPFEKRRSALTIAGSISLTISLTLFQKTAFFSNLWDRYRLVLHIVCWIIVLTLGVKVYGWQLKWFRWKLGFIKEIDLVVERTSRYTVQFIDDLLETKKAIIRTRIETINTPSIDPLIKKFVNDDMPIYEKLLLQGKADKVIDLIENNYKLGVEAVKKVELDKINALIPKVGAIKPPNWLWNKASSTVEAVVQLAADHPYRVVALGLGIRVFVGQNHLSNAITFLKKAQETHIVSTVTSDLVHTTVIKAADTSIAVLTESVLGSGAKIAVVTTGLKVVRNLVNTSKQSISILDKEIDQVNVNLAATNKTVNELIGVIEVVEVKVAAVEVKVAAVEVSEASNKVIIGRLTERLETLGALFSEEHRVVTKLVNFIMYLQSSRQLRFDLFHRDCTHQSAREVEAIAKGLAKWNGPD